MRLDFFILADGVATDDAGKLVILGASVTHVRTTTIPARVERLASIARLLIEEDDPSNPEPFRVHVRWIRPDGTAASDSDVVVIRPQEIDRPAHEGEERALFVIVEMPGLTFNSVGAYRLALVLNDETIAERPLVVFEELDEAASDEQPEAG